MDKKLIIYSIPKCGTHFLSQIVALLIDRNCNIYDKDELYKYVAHLTKKNLSQTINRPFFATHPKPNYLPYDKIRPLPHKKIFMVRNPLDKTISRYFYRIYYRADPQKLAMINKNLNEHIFKYCLENLKTYCNEIVTHMDMSKEIPGSVLFDYGTVFDNKKKYIRIMAEMLEIPITDELVDFIYEKTDIKKCSEYESKFRSFNVGAIQNGLFFRQGGSRNYEKYLTPQEIERLKIEIPQYLHGIYKF